MIFNTWDNRRKQVLCPIKETPWYDVLIEVRERTIVGVVFCDQTTVRTQFDVTPSATVTEIRTYCLHKECMTFPQNTRSIYLCQ